MAFWHARPEAPHVLWSLAVEEHFYMVWPFAVRWLKRESLIRCLIALLILEPLLRLGVCLWLHPDGNLLYYLTFFRLDSIGLGCLLAILVERPENTELLRRWSVAGFALVAVIYFAVHRALGAAFLRESNTPVYNTLIYSLIGLCCFWLLAHLITRPKGLAARLLAWSPLVWVGTISYGVYLYHLPILGGLMAAFQWTPRHAALPAAVIALLVAWISFKAMEQPAIAWGRRRAGQKEGDLARPPAGSHGRLQSE
jgi:peptidoglycan/LPS O-acetylase OafA/YrhL